MMLILIGIVPGYFALNAVDSPKAYAESNHTIGLVLQRIDAGPLSDSDKKALTGAIALSRDLETHLVAGTIEAVPKEERFLIRKDVMLIDRHIRDLLDAPEINLSVTDKERLHAGTINLRKLIDYSPKWVIVMIALSIGFGTMVGWKRIVKTIGEKIGKEHLNYAQGASSELVAASTIGLSSLYGWPVSTTQVLSSGIAGSMVANKGVKNLQIETVRNIMLAWFLTLPVVMILSGTLFLLFRSIF